MTVERRRRSILLYATLTLAAGCARRDSVVLDRGRLQSALRDSVGMSADPQVGLISDGGPRGSHLLIQLDTPAFSNLGDPQFVDSARRIARFATRHYTGSQYVDSVTVMARMRVQSGLWKIHHAETFGMRELSGR
jgi:hypothetical protein